MVRNIANTTTQSRAPRTRHARPVDTRQCAVATRVRVHRHGNRDRARSHGTKRDTHTVDVTSRNGSITPQTAVTCLSGFSNLPPKWRSWRRRPTIAYARARLSAGNPPAPSRAARQKTQTHGSHTPDRGARPRHLRDSRGMPPRTAARSLAGHNTSGATSPSMPPSIGHTVCPRPRSLASALRPRMPPASPRVISGESSPWTPRHRSSDTPLAHMTSTP